MPDRESLKHRIQSGESIKVADTSLDVSRSQLEDILSQDSYDLVGVDSQHVPSNEEKLVAFCAMAEDLGVPVQFRIKHTRHTYLIGNCLDLGPLAIVVPQVEEEATVDEAINFFYYPPVGKRSWGPSRGYGFKQDRNRQEYADWWNNNGILSIQLESINAVTNARKLAKPGVDMFLFGPSDLSFSLESYPDHPFKTLDDCVQHVKKQMEGTQVQVGE